jgi:purine-binding chemotaxis protein CheW
MAYTSPVRHVVFRVSQERYALPLSAVREVVVPGVMSRVPRAPAAVRGIMNLRGRVVTVVDLGTLLAVAPLPAEAHGAALGKVVLLDRGRRDLGILVGEVDTIVAIDELGVAPGVAMPAVRGVARVGEQALTVLAADGLDAQVTALFQGP